MDPEANKQFPIQGSHPVVNDHTVCNATLPVRRGVFTRALHKQLPAMRCNLAKDLPRVV